MSNKTKLKEKFMIFKFDNFEADDIIANFCKTIRTN